MKEHLHSGFTYRVEVVRDGQVVDSEVVDNLMPTEGLNHILNVLLKGAAQNASWYIGLYEGAYTPDAASTAATFPAAATEVTAYAETNRVLFQGSTVSGGQSNNSAARAEFTLSANKTVTGGFIASAPGKGATSGVLLSVVRFSSPKVVEAGSVLRVTAGVSLNSL